MSAFEYYNRVKRWKGNRGSSEAEGLAPNGRVSTGGHSAQSFSDAYDTTTSATSTLSLSCTFSDLDPDLRFSLPDQVLLTQTLNSGKDVRSAYGLVSAAEEGDVKRVWLLLKRGVDVEIVQEGLGSASDLNALEAAAGQGYLQVVDILLKHGAVLNASGTNRPTPLQCAIFSQRDEPYAQLESAKRFSREDTVSYLLRKGADPNFQSDHIEFTALCTAARHGQLRAGEILLSAGADPNLFRPSYGSALHAAVEWRRADFVELLLRHGGNPNLPACEKGSCLAVAASHHFGPAFQSVQQPDETLVLRLLDAGADVRIEGGDCGSALQAASARCSPRIVEKLLALGAEVNANGGKYGSALYQAAKYGADENMRLLLQYGADVNLISNDSDGKRQTPLQAATLNGKITVAEILLQAGARASWMPGEGGSALVGAAMHCGYNSERWLKLMGDLLEKGAATDDADLDSYSPLSYACKWNGIEAVKLLLAHGAKINNVSPRLPALQAALESGNLDIIALLLSHGADITVEMTGSKSAIACVISGYKKSSYINHDEEFEKAKKNVQILKDHGAKIDDGNGSALLEAISSGKTEMVEYIIEQGADVNLPERPPDALRYAIRSSGRRYIRLRMKDLLRKHGAVSIDRPKRPSLEDDVDPGQMKKSDCEDKGILSSEFSNIVLGDPNSSKGSIFTLKLALKMFASKYSSDDAVPLKQIRILGRGSTGSVDVVSMSNSAIRSDVVLARKTFSLSHKPHLRADQEEKASNEIKVIQRLQHQHVVKFLATYQTPSQVGILMTPIGDSDLARYLADKTSFNPDEMKTVCTWFGCLASGLAYIHSQGIRHKDIKPANLIIYKNDILFADFNIAKPLEEIRDKIPKRVLDSDDENYNRMATKSKGPSGKTVMYCAPEIAAETWRGRKADIFSLGCVFLEMLNVTTGHTMAEFEQYRWSYPLASFHANYERAMKWMFMLVAETLGEKVSSSSSTKLSNSILDAIKQEGLACEGLDMRTLPFEWCFAMLQPTDTYRMSAKNLLRVIRAWDNTQSQKRSLPGSFHDLPERYIGDCCSQLTSTKKRILDLSTSNIDMSVHLIRRWPILNLDFEREIDHEEFTAAQINEYCQYQYPKPK